MKMKWLCQNWSNVHCHDWRFVAVKMMRLLVNYRVNEHDASDDDADLDESWTHVARHDDGGAFHEFVMAAERDDVDAGVCDEHGALHTNAVDDARKLWMC